MEAALVIPVMLIVIIAVLEIVAAVAVRLDLVAAAREGARVAATVPAPDDRAVAAVRDALPERLRSRVQVSVSRSAEVGAAATVTVRLDLPLQTPLLDRLRVPLEVRAVMSVER